MSKLTVARAMPAWAMIVLIFSVAMQVTPVLSRSEKVSQIEQQMHPQIRISLSRMSVKKGTLDTATYHHTNVYIKCNAQAHNVKLSLFKNYSIEINEELTYFSLDYVSVDKAW